MRSWRKKALSNEFKIVLLLFFLILIFKTVTTAKNLEFQNLIFLATF